MEKFVVVDLETTGHASAKDDKIIEIGIVTIENGEIVEQYSTFLNPQRKIPPFITNLTGISEQDVSNAPIFSEVAAAIRSKFEGACLIAHNVPFDLGFLNDELKAAGQNKLECPVLDTVELSRILHPQAPSYKLSQIAEHLGIFHDAPHRALADAFVTARLFLTLREKLSSLPVETIVHLGKLQKVLKSDLSVLLDGNLESFAPGSGEQSDIVSHHGLAFKKIHVEQKEARELSVSFHEYLDDIYEESGRLENEFAGYEKRTGQRDMSELIFDAFESKKHALVEAETGTGKTLGYLLPALYEAVKRNERIVISTYTTQLQSQLLDEEIPLVSKLVPFSFAAALLKGKYHYLSLEKLAFELQQPEIGNYDIALSKAMLLVWITETETGDIDEIQLPSNGYHFYKRVSAEAEGELNPHSSWLRHSYYQIARKKAQRADLVITNHALLCADMASDYELLPPYRKAILDEAHQFEGAASRRYGLKLDYVHMQYALNDIGATDENDLVGRLIRKSSGLFDDFLLGRWDHVFKEAIHELDSFFRYIFSYVKERKLNSYSDTGRIQYRFEPENETAKAWNAIQEMAERLIFQFRDLVHYLLEMRSRLIEAAGPGMQELDELRLAVERLQFYIDSLEQMFLLHNENEVKWVEIEAKGAKNAVYLFSEPASVSEQLAEQFFAAKDSIVLASATLTMNGSFAYARERLGLDQTKIMEKKIASPFKYDEQVQLLVPDDFPDIRKENLDDFIYSVCEAVFSLAEITEGRMLVLFTSFDMLKRSYYLLKEFMDDEEYVLIAQGITSGSRTRLKKNFQSYDKAILLGTNSFWEGIDIPGEDLSCLVIARLPFLPPNQPVYEAKAKAMEAEGRNAFYDLSLPNAVIRFKQGFGRLIRSRHDRGIVFVCDSRLKKSSYGRYFIKSIPKVPLTYDSTAVLLEKAKQWF